jgi:general secretion pathway protein F
MPAFRYVAVNADGRLQRGVMDASDAASVVERLQHQGHIPMRAEPAGRSGWLFDILSYDLGRKSLRRQDTADIVRELATMLASGQDVDRALRFVIEISATKRAREVMTRVRDKVRSGSSLADALSSEPASFPRLHVALVRAGEAGGALADTLDRLALMLERERSLSLAVQSALIYPALLTLAGSASILFLVSYVLPQFVPLLQQNGAKVPASTRMLMMFGDALRSTGPYIFLATLVVGFGVRRLLKEPAFRCPLDRLLLNLPILGRILRESLAARFTRTLGTLLRNGVPLVGALSIAKDTVRNLAAANAVKTATESAKAGMGLAVPLADADLFPLRTTQLLLLGEETSQLAAMALRAADIHEERTRIAVQRLVALIVPTLTIAMGLAVAAIVGSVLMAMLSLNDLAL